MISGFAPEEIKKFLIEVFEDKNNPAYGQVATLSENRRPHVRTVHIHYRKEFDALAFSAHTASSKWKELEKNPYLSGCFFDMVRFVQFRWESQVQLLSGDSLFQGQPLLEAVPERDCLQAMWKLMREEVRQAYWLDSDKLLGTDKVDTQYDLNKRALGHGVVVCHPSSWTLYKMNPQVYSKGQCTRYELKNDTWISKKVSILGCDL